jgi:hypothetical protein
MGNLTGQKIYVLKTVNGLWKKVWIKELSGFGSVYTMLIANLDGSNPQTAVIDKSNYNTKQFFYYDVENDSIRDVEPARGDWDLVFRRYQASVGPGFYYPANGVLHNIGVEVAEATGVDPETVTDNGLNYSTEINTIGYDWKNQMLVVDTARAYFVRDLDGDIWKLVFTGFESGFSPPQTGTAFFWKELISPATGIQLVEGGISEYTVYPNPANASSQVIFRAEESATSRIEVINTAGQVVQSYAVNANQGLNNYRIVTENLSEGIYVIRLSNGVESVSKQLLIVR